MKKDKFSPDHSDNHPNTSDNRKEWVTPELIKEDIKATQAGTPAGPTENAFYHT